VKRAGIGTASSQPDFRSAQDMVGPAAAGRRSGDGGSIRVAASTGGD
jgi:hypothetical protein